MLQQLVELKNTLVAEVGYVLLLLFPPAAVIFHFWRHQKKQKLEAETPFDELRRRPAGESNRLQVEHLDEKIDPWLMGLAVIPILLALYLALQKPNPVVFLIGFLAVAIYSIVAQRKLGPLLEDRAAYRLGFHGERYVAEELNQLMAEGLRVFHDLPFDKYNIDHVVVGPAGVFAIETKTKRKRLTDGKEKHKVTFDGKKLQFANGWNTEWLDQTRLNTKSLSRWLQSATAETIEAEAILTIPGWWIEREGRSDVHVLNPKEIKSLVLSPVTKNPLNEQQVQRVSHQLEEKCKLAIE